MQTMYTILHSFLFGINAQFALLWLALRQQPDLQIRGSSFFGERVRGPPVVHGGCAGFWMLCVCVLSGLAVWEIYEHVDAWSLHSAP